MIPIPIFGIPHYNQPEILERCVHSIDYPVEKLVIVQNGLDEWMPCLDHKARTLGGVVWPECIGEIVHIQHPNSGVAAAWNEIIKLFPAEWWLISNNDIQFMPGDLQTMAEAVQGSQTGADGAAQDSPVACFYGNHGASWFVITTLGVEAVGLFDENIFPAYLEDCDWSYRCDLLGLPRLTVQGLGSVHGVEGHGSCTVNATEELKKENDRTHGGNFDYYREKWGGANEHEVYKTPFNKPDWPIWAWHFFPAWRAQQQWKPPSASSVTEKGAGDGESGEVS